MEAAQRAALLETMLAELGREGYRGLSLPKVLAASGTSEAEFEAEFADTDECLIAAYDELAGRVVEKATNGCDAEQAWPERVRSALTTLLSVLAAEPEMAKVMIRAFPGVRPSFYRHYVDFIGGFLPFMREGREFSGIEEELPAEVELLAVGAAESIIFGELEAGRAERLPSLLPEILFSVLVPFIGPDRAADEMKSAAAAL